MNGFKNVFRLAIIGAAFVAALVVPAAASAHFSPAPAHPVFVQTGNITGNQIAAYNRAADGTLTLNNTYNTGGLGGALDGAVVDLTASQGSLEYDRANDLLYAVNAGSNSISVLAVDGVKLRLRQVINSRGNFPVSLTVKNDVVYVLNARSGGNVAGFRVIAGRLFPLIASTRDLGLDPAATPEFTHTPGHVKFTPDGSKLVVTTKGNTSALDIFKVRFDGRLSATPTVTPLPGAVPFAVDFGQRGNLAVSEAGAGALETFKIAADGSATHLDAAPTNQAATCWVTSSNGVYYVSNAGSATVSLFSEGANGKLTALGQTPTDAGTVDADASADGRFLYVQTGKFGIVDAYRIGAGGSLTAIGNVTVAGAIGGEGIVAL